MAKKITEAQQDEAYDHGYRSCEHRAFASRATYVNPYDSDKYFLLYRAYEKGWNDRCSYEREVIAKR